MVKGRRMVLTMTDAQQREAARQFFIDGTGKSREDEDARTRRTRKELIDGLLFFPGVSSQHKET